jgi:hypothetical protein
VEALTEKGASPVVVQSRRRLGPEAKATHSGAGVAAVCIRKALFER